jgi:hypothetical protein
VATLVPLAVCNNTCVDMRWGNVSSGLPSTPGLNSALQLASVSMNVTLAAVAGGVPTRAWVSSASTISRAHSFCLPAGVTAWADKWAVVVQVTLTDFYGVARTFTSLQALTVDTSPPLTTLPGGTAWVMTNGPVADGHVAFWPVTNVTYGAVTPGAVFGDPHTSVETFEFMLQRWLHSTVWSLEVTSTVVVTELELAALGRVVTTPPSMSPQLQCGSDYRWRVRWW